jgi:2-C-methyl-D-erythritol 2,4-cyclodiphosphate synthase
MLEYRVGHGYDVHRFAEDRALVLGGVKIPFKLGLLGHSDADVLLHAVMDAILGAMGLYDIGRHFPDTGEEFSGISSIELLMRVKALMDEGGYKISNVDSTLILQKPKISPYIDKMRENIAKALQTDYSRVNVKATTEEGLGFTGNMLGAAAHAVVMLIKEKE